MRLRRPGRIDDADAVFDHVTMAGQEKRAVFEIAFDTPLKLVRLKISGTMPTEEALRLASELTAAAQTARLRFGVLRLLADAQEAPIQSKEATRALPRPSDIIVDPADRSGVIIASALAKLQTDRVLGHAQARAFLDPQAALDWVTGREPAD